MTLVFIESFFFVFVVVVFVNGFILKSEKLRRTAATLQPMSCYKVKDTRIRVER